MKICDRVIMHDVEGTCDEEIARLVKLAIDGLVDDRTTWIVRDLVGPVRLAVRGRLLKLLSNTCFHVS